MHKNITVKLCKALECIFYYLLLHHKIVDDTAIFSLRMVDRLKEKRIL